MKLKQHLAQFAEYYLAGGILAVLIALFVLFYRNIKAAVQSFDTLIHEDLVKENKDAFLSKVKRIAVELGISPNWLMQVMKKESGINSHIRNSIGGATGLIQFMPSTARSLGVTTDQLAAMSNVEQLDYVKKYFAPYAKYIKSYPDLYLVTFFPAALSKPDDWYFQTSGLSAETIGAQNKVINSGQPINKKAFREYVWRGISAEEKKLLA